MPARLEVDKDYGKGLGPALCSAGRGERLPRSREEAGAGSNATGTSENLGDPYLTAAHERGKLNHR